MKKMSVKKIIIILLALFVALFIARAIYDLATYEDADSYYTNYYGSYSLSAPSSAPIQNIAGFRKEISTSSGVEILDQKYEKIASITTKTINYDEDERQLTNTIEECSAVVQMENKSGLVGSRRINMTIGVKPDYFETAIERINEIGKITSFVTTKTDKTYEYRQMIAEKEKLTRQIESYQDMKDHGGSITELLLLEDRIIEFEALLKEQSVMLGDYSDENAFCTIQFTMHEGNVTSVWHKLWNALTWSAVVYLSFIGILLSTCLAAIVIFAICKYGKRIYDKATQKVPNSEKTEK